VVTIEKNTSGTTTYVQFIVVDDPKSPPKRRPRVKWYQIVRIAEEVLILRERTTT
jgi:hypothetical protein